MLRPGGMLICRHTKFALIGREDVTQSMPIE